MQPPVPPPVLFSYPLGGASQGATPAVSLEFWRAAAGRSRGHPHVPGCPAWTVPRALRDGKHIGFTSRVCINSCRLHLGAQDPVAHPLE
jgi:hypothetical protein